MTTPLLDTWEALCDAGRQAVERMDKDRWLIGDLAISATWQADGNLVEYAREIGLGYKSVYQYRTMALFYPVSTRVEFADTNITYSHMREAMRLRDPILAIEILREASDNGWSSDKTGYEVSEELKGGVGGADDPLEPCTDDELNTLRVKYSANPTHIIPRLIATIDQLKAARVR